MRISKTAFGLWLGLTLVLAFLAVDKFSTLYKAGRLILNQDETGHRGYGVENQEACDLVLQALAAIDGLGNDPLRFQVGPTDQTLLKDTFTVIASYSDEVGDIPKNFISRPTKNPVTDANTFADFLRQKYPDTQVREVTSVNGKPIKRGSMYAVWSTRAMIDWCMVYRLPGRDMGLPGFP